MTYSEVLDLYEQGIAAMAIMAERAGAIDAMPWWQRRPHIAERYDLERRFEELDKTLEALNYKLQQWIQEMESR